MNIVDMYESYLTKIIIALIGVFVVLLIASIIFVLAFRKKKCPKCGRKIDKDSNYCKYCGEKV
jgi:rRNA maturation endonuclease Nob1